MNLQAWGVLALLLVGCSGGITTEGAGEDETDAGSDAGAPQPVGTTTVPEDGQTDGSAQENAQADSSAAEDAQADSSAPDAPYTCNGCVNTPLVLAFNDEPVEFTHAAGSFDLAGRAASIATEWVGSATPWLALDRNGNGAIDDGSELFGSMTELAGGERAPNGFVALSALDDDGDGQITARDASFARLLVWRDANQDRQSSPDEIESAEAAGVVAIQLRYRVEPRCVPGACEMERARFVYRDGAGRDREGAVIDVHLSARPSGL